MSQKLSLREELKDASLQVIKDRIHKELVSMNNEELHTFIRLQRESDRSQDPKTFNLNMLSLIDQVNEAKGQRISSSEDTQATANELDFSGQSNVSQKVVSSQQSKKSPPQKSPVEERSPATNGNGDEKRSKSPRRRIGQYEMIKTLGQGTFAKVKLAENIYTKEKVAIKVIDKSNLKGQKQIVSMKREIHLMKYLRHPHIVGAVEVFETEKEFFIVMDYVQSGELFDYIVSHGKLSEPEARRIFRQLISAIDYCHQNSIIHRDLKPENLLMDSSMNIKIIDFGFGNTFHREQLLNTFCGSPFYAAPEMIKGVKYIGPEVDIWSMGVILYAILTGRLPFDGKDLTELYERINAGKYAIPCELSPESIDLIGRMLTVQSSKRATLSQVKNHPWVLKQYLTPPDNYLHPRPSFVPNPNLESVNVLKGVGFSEDEVTRVLKRDIGLHPIVCLYHLAEESKLPRPVMSDYIKDSPLASKPSPESVTRATSGLKDLSIKSDVTSQPVHVHAVVKNDASKAVPIPNGASSSTAAGPQRKISLKKFFLFNTDPKNKINSKSTSNFTRASKEDSSMDIDEIMDGGNSGSGVKRIESGFDVKNGAKEIKGFFNITTTTDRSLHELMEEIEQALIAAEVSFEKKLDKVTGFPVYVAQDASGNGKNIHNFEISIVASDGQHKHAIQFKRLKGSLLYHKKLASRIIQAMAL